MSDELEPIPPGDATDLFMSEHEDELADTTIRNYNRTIDLIEQFCSQTGEGEDARINNLNDMSGRDILRFKTFCKERTEMATISLNGKLAQLRVLLKFWEKIDAVRDGLSEDIPFPNVSDEQKVRTEMPPDELVSEIKRNLEQYKTASRHHVEFEIIRELGLRRGVLRALDKRDIDLEEPCLIIRHRPQTDTPLKNGSESQRQVNISEELAELIGAYLDNPERPSGTDEYGREPFLTTESKGTVERIAANRITKDFYKFSRPCKVGWECPQDCVDKDDDPTSAKHASKCTANFSPHSLRRWSITRQLSEGVRLEVVSGRVDVSPPVLEQHYDQRSEEQKRKNRLTGLRKHLPEYSDEGESADETDQKSLDDFRSVIGPLSVVIAMVLRTARLTKIRVWEELNDLAPDEAESPLPDRTKFAKGMAAYALFVLLVAWNFILLSI